MSREFKFRVYVKELRKFIYFELGEFLYPERYLNQNGIDIQQFTGIKDAKGNPIYEGDIINTIYEYDPHNCIGKVIYHDETASYRIKTDKNLLPIVTFRFVEDKPQGLLNVVNEVIGNEYEKPPCNFDHNADCLVCDGSPSDCPFVKTRKLEIKSDKPLMTPLNTNYKLDIHDKPSN